MTYTLIMAVFALCMINNSNSNKRHKDTEEYLLLLEERILKLERKERKQ